VNEQAYNQQ
jgi:hypothetical protein